MKNVLVTGANGQLGKSIQKIQRNYRYLNFDFFDSNQLDITNSECVSSAFAKKKYHYCINCAAYTSVEKAEKYPENAFAVNAEGVKKLSETCLKYETILIHISTDYVFDGEKETGYLPSDTPNPINEYGKSKLQGEHYIQEILKKYFIIRTSWLYSEFGKNFYKTIMAKAVAGEDLYITDEQIGCPTNANNLAVYLCQLITETKSDFGIHHFTDRKAMSWYGFAQRILEEHDFKDKVKLDKAQNYRTFAKRPRNTILS